MACLKHYNIRQNIYEEMKYFLLSRGAMQKINMLQITFCKIQNKHPVQMQKKTNKDKNFDFF